MEFFFLSCMHDTKMIVIPVIVQISARSLRVWQSAELRWTSHLSSIDPHGGLSNLGPPIDAQRLRHAIYLDGERYSRAQVRPSLRRRANRAVARNADELYVTDEIDACMTCVSRRKV